MYLSKRRWIKAICGGVVLCLTLSIGGLYGQAATVRESVVRLHILPHSDTTADQTLKLQVRDAVTAAAAGWLDTAADPEEALATAREQLPRLQAIAEEVVQEAGCAYSVKVSLERMYFTTRQYGTLTLPAGMYHAVRITLGDGAGQNWWCVAFPPLCVGGAADEAGWRQAGLDPPALTRGGSPYILRFKVLEWVESFLQLFR